MTGETPPGQLAEVLRLSALLADRVLDAFIMKHAISSDQTIALAKAARLLQDHGVEWPPLLTDVIRLLASQDEEALETEAESSTGQAKMVVGNLSRFFGKPPSGPEQP